MITFGALIDNLKDAVTDSTDDAENRIKRALNLAYIEVCSMRDWDFLKREKEPSVATLTSAVPLVLPTNLCKIIGTIIDVDSSDNEYHFYYSHSRNRVNLKHLYNWYYTDPVSTPLASGTTVAVAENATAVTSTAEFPATDCSGEFIRIGENLGLYEIATWTSTSAITLVDGFRGKAIQAGDTYFEIRPVGFTKRMNFCDNEGNFYAPTAPKIAYTIYPLPLYNLYDVVQLPGDASPVFYKAMKKLARAKGWGRVADAAEADFIASYAAAQRVEPLSQESMKPPTAFKIHDKLYSWGK